MAFIMNEYLEDGTIKDYDILNQEEIFTEGFSEDRRYKKEKKKLLSFMRDAVIRILQEMWKLFPRNATLFTCSISKEKGKWVPKTWIYMTRDVKNEKPVQESSYQKTFNISKEQMNHLKDVCVRTLEYVGRNTILDTTDIDLIIINVFFDGSGNYRFGKKSTVSKSNYAKEIVNEMGVLPDSVDSPTLKLTNLNDDFSGVI